MPVTARRAGTSEAERPAPVAAIGTRRSVSLAWRVVVLVGTQSWKRAITYNCVCQNSRLFFQIVS